MTRGSICKAVGIQPLLNLCKSLRPIGFNAGYDKFTDFLTCLDAVITYGELIGSTDEKEVFRDLFPECINPE